MSASGRKPDRREAGSRRSKLVAAATVLGAAAIVVTIAALPSAVEPVPPAEPVPVNVTVQRVEPVPELADTFTLTGVVQPRVVVSVSAEVAGRIEAYGTRVQEARWPANALAAGSPIVEGQPVTQGDSLVILNRDLLAARHARALAHFEHDEHEYQRILGLYERNIASQHELRQAQRSRDVSRAELDEATRSLELATIEAPTSGILNAWRMEVGEYATPGQVVAEIVDIEMVKVWVDIPERDIGYLHIGQTAEIIPLAGDSEPVTGTITYINVLADEATRTTRIEVTVDNRLFDQEPNAGDIQRALNARASGAQGDGLDVAHADNGREYKLRSGQIVNVRLVRRMLQDVIMVPLGSVIPLEDGMEVYVVNDGKAERRPIQLGFIRGRSVQAASGLQPGEHLIVSGHRLVSHGQPVNVIDNNTQ